MRKQSQTVSVPLTSKAVKILKRYEGKQEKRTNITMASMPYFGNVASTVWCNP